MERRALAPYAYVGANPISKIDPLGLVAWSCSDVQLAAGEAWAKAWAEVECNSACVNNRPSSWQGRPERRHRDDLLDLQRSSRDPDPPDQRRAGRHLASGVRALFQVIILVWRLRQRPVSTIMQRTASARHLQITEQLMKRLRGSLLASALIAPLIGYIAMELVPFQSLLHSLPPRGFMGDAAWLVTPAAIGFVMAYLHPRHWLLLVGLSASLGLLMFATESLRHASTLWPIGLVLRGWWLRAAVLGGLVGMLLKTARGAEPVRTE
jgi:hypothetical protein